MSETSLKHIQQSASPHELSGAVPQPRYQFVFVVVLIPIDVETPEVRTNYGTKLYTKSQTLYYTQNLSTYQMLLPNLFADELPILPYESSQHNNYKKTVNTSKTHT